MLRLVLVLISIKALHSEQQTMQYHMRVARKSRSNSAPQETGYVYTRVNNNPATFAAYTSNQVSHEPLPVAQPLVAHRETHRDINTDTSKRYTINPIKKYSDTDLSNHNFDTSRMTSSTVKASDKPGDATYKAASDVKSLGGKNHIISSHPHEYNKAKSKYDSRYSPANMKSDAMYERLKSLMHYQPPSNIQSDFSYGTYSHFHVDQNDVRSSSTAPYDSWPYFYQSPFEYEHKKVKSGLEKVKDKRYAVDTLHKVIPVHEHHEPDISHLPDTHYTADVESTTDDHPFSGHQPFFSFVLNDYFDPKNNPDEDSLSFKGLDWGQDFDYERNDNEKSEGSENGKRNRRLPSRYHQPTTAYHDDSNTQSSHEHGAVGESVTENAYANKHEFDKDVRDGKLHSKDRKAYERAGNNQNQFKHFADTFANKFGSEDHKKNAHYALEKNQDKGEKRKGFHRVYHKDEYSEDKEFYDNSNQNAKAQEAGSSAAHAGGSEATLQSHAVAAAGNEANAYNDAADRRSSKLRKHRKGHDHNNGSDSQFNRYRDVAKKTAQSNTADYDHDHY